MPTLRASLAIATFLALAACSSSRRGNPDTTAPTIIAATFVGAAAVPAAGDALQLFCSEDVELAGGLLTDADLTLSAGASLGAVTAAPVLLSARVVQVTLGAGVAFTPGTSTLGFGPGNDALRDRAGNRGVAGTPVAIARGDAEAPTISRLTVSGVDDLTNGNGPALGTLQVPQNGFTIDLTYADATSAVDPAGTMLAADVAVNVGGQTLPAGSDLVPSLTATSVTATDASYLVPATVAFPVATFTLTALVRDTSGRVSAPATFTLRATGLTDTIRPFETSVNPGQVWFLDLTRDLESYTLVNTAGDRYAITANPTPNGNADLWELFPFIGLHGADAGVNTTVRNQFQARVLTELAQFFAGVNVSFTYTSPGSFPNGQSTVAYNALGFSRMCIAGAPTDAGTLGLAQFDPNNDTQNDNCTPDNLGRRTGVFVMTMLHNTSALGGPAGTLFRLTYDPLRAEIPQVPAGFAIGNHPDGFDADRLAGTRLDARTTVIANAINRLARFVAMVTAHECGHSMGLVKNGAMPDGLFGNDPGNFPGSTSAHIKMPTTLFPAGSTNIMSPAVNLDLATGTATAFNTLNLAYLRERVLQNR